MGLALLISIQVSEIIENMKIEKNVVILYSSKGMEGL